MFCLKFPNDFNTFIYISVWLERETLMKQGHVLTLFVHLCHLNMQGTYKSTGAAGVTCYVHFFLFFFGTVASTFSCVVFKIIFFRLVVIEIVERVTATLRKPDVKYSSKLLWTLNMYYRCKNYQWKWMAGFGWLSGFWGTE